MSKLYMRVLTSKPALAVLYRLIRTYSWTFRLTVENERPWMDYLKGGGVVLLCGLHQQFFAAIRHFKTYENFQPSLMISKSIDGNLIAGVAQRSGWLTVRGSSSKDGHESLAQMIANLSKFHLAAHVVDGPRGPAGIVKAGVIRLAQATGAVIVPCYTAADRAWYFKSWDRFMLPRPFAKVTLRYGSMINLQTDHADKDFEGQRLYLEKIMKPELHAAHS